MVSIGFPMAAGCFVRVVASIAACLSIILPTGWRFTPRDQSVIPDQHDARRVSVVDAIEMTEFGDSNYLTGAFVKYNPAHFSPDGKRFVIVTKTGNIKENTNHYSLLLFQTNNVLGSPNPDVVLSMSSSSNRIGIQNIKWVDDHTVALLGENPGELQQLYVVDCDTKKVIKLTSHLTGVTSYAITPDGDKMFFLAGHPAEPLFDERTGRDWVVVSDQLLWDLIAGGSQSLPSAFADLFVITKKGSQESPVGNQTNLDPSGLWVSPNGRYLIVKTLVGDIPQIWKDYENGWLQTLVRATLSRGARGVVYQYGLIDIESGQSRPLINAPLSSGRTEVIWSPDSTFVVVSGTYLPLNVSDSAERKVRQSKKMLAEIKIPSLDILPISSGELHPLKWAARSGDLLVESTPYSGVSVSEGDLLAFERGTAGWKEVKLPKSDVRHSDQINVTLEEDMNTPPKLFARDAQTGQTSFLLDLNPQFKDLKFGRVQSVTFRATDGHEVNGGLYLPPDFAQGRRYPLVIQTHAWRPDRFWIDGPWPSAFAAQPLAGRGFVVLQLAEDSISLKTGKSNSDEAPKEASAYEGAIDYLDTLGLINRDRVGLVGFSRTGLGVEYALTHSNYHFAAASMADISDAGYFFYLSLIPALSWRYPDLEEINGGPPFGNGLSSWLKNSPDFNLARVTTPVREEAYHPHSLFFEWEWFAGLSRLGKPVELIYIPGASHVLVRPRDRLISQQGTVDWFCFWLRDEEDPDPAKAEQYSRWRGLRSLQQGSLNKIGE